ncbi:hypothetical protein [Vibrio parahaemolyticus]|uniref:hypothetical protein n=1 Tax=Vibrio parahaemolyticus TaxID=670 RepID=UPI00178223AA|nr:hypothetical protein [Vibrio parahaemolyticus]MBD6946494.1 hypothetical protein [Vibrio parahaemolyticus]MBD6960088.1 hypothetical protein [Vibrio parahaemolyticus]MBD6979239.1 hypothetical protein [Vibrio parahaemolyticus]MBD6992294.1 hypothetical protein [Vibrio parahaemolyticus]
MTGLKHEKSINKILSFFHEPWMTESDKQDVDNYALKKIGTSRETLNAQIEEGVALGVSAEYQVELVLKSLSKAFPEN